MLMLLKRRRVSQQLPRSVNAQANLLPGVCYQGAQPVKRIIEVGKLEKRVAA